MNSLETEYFSELSKDRADSAKTLKKRSMIGIWKSVVENMSSNSVENRTNSMARSTFDASHYVALSLA